MAELAGLETGERVRVLGGRNFEKLAPEHKDSKARAKKPRAESRFHGGMEGTVAGSSGFAMLCQC